MWGLQRAAPWRGHFLAAAMTKEVRAAVEKISTPIIFILFFCKNINSGRCGNWVAQEWKNCTLAEHACSKMCMICFTENELSPMIMCSVAMLSVLIHS